ncbi:hypothetical protein LCGC14_1424130 [marine sediment metagenome]|uniref:Uncharacterized protein n=1 Tax=marine sediment metagenome TaxID=412755 RepID=A0A0F9MS70_9ZZZZ
MSTNVYISAIKLPDDAWQKHQTVWDACNDAGVEIPQETSDYFNGEPPGLVGVVIGLGSIMYPKGDCVREFSDEYTRGVEVDVTMLPSNTRFIRVTWG